MAQAMLEFKSPDEKHFIEEYKKAHLLICKNEIDTIIRNYIGYEYKRKNPDQLYKKVLIKQHITKVITANAEIEATHIAENQYSELYNHYECDECNHRFSNEDDFLLHQIQHENDDEIDLIN
jgi:hypothetical protein